ncbi:MAG: peptidoglycan editing factor PgeF [Candidatus Hydrogenedentes bacterium]|nr:peptidoglycan editing factor PgeF [Candidatus Hydrogenedentota bacterium]
MMRFPEFEGLGLPVAAFSGKDDGDCGLRNPDSLADSLDNRRRFCQALGTTLDNLVCAQQVHGTAIAPVCDADRGRGARAWDLGVPDTDGLVTDTPGLALAVFVADCVPVFLYDPIRKAAALVHAGRRGTLANIAGHAVDVLRTRFGVRPADLHALIGPSAGPDAYEVSPEMARQWREARLPARGRLLDLWEANALQLSRAGVHRRHIALAGVCTIADRRFFSYRAGDGSGRNMALIKL